MLEFYQAYATYEDLMILTEQLISSLANRLFELELKAEESKALRARKEDETAINDNIGAIKERMGKLAFAFGDNAISYKPPFRRLTIREALLEYGPGIKEETLTSAEALYRYAESVNLEINPAFKDDYGRMLMEVFEGVVESKLVQPTFITQFPIEVSPLSRRNEANPGFVDRFELYVAGSEIANAFSELNDPVDQRGRFEAQARLKEKGDEEAHVFDHDYIRALEYGMPPTGGEGIGIDRLTMLFTNQESIREVILFPLLRPEV
jgi:lysyl-tRNA synthetase class 2